MNINTKRRVFLWLKIIIGLLIVAYAAFFISTYRQIKRGEMVEFQGHWYTREELRQILPPQEAPLKEAINTTEEVYTAFREALLGGDIEEALGYIREEDREYYVEAFNDRERIKTYLEIPPFSELDQDDEIDNFQKGYRYYEEGRKRPYTVSFKLNQKTRLWEIVGI